MLLHSDWVIGTALVDVVVGKDHALSVMDHTNASNDVSKGHALFVTSELADFKEG